VAGRTEHGAQPGSKPSTLPAIFLMTVQDLKAKHDRLKKLDKPGLFRNGTYKIFGSETHQYKYNPCLTNDYVKKFEQSFSISLPFDYKYFITQIGNGGSGPYYGLFTLSDWDFELEIKDKNFLSTNFPHTDKWNIIQDDVIDYDDENEMKKYLAQVTGSMRICHYGCGVYYLLVVTGDKAGHIWVDDRASDNGIYQSVSKSTGKHQTFFDWYNDWLDESLSQFP